MNKLILSLCLFSSMATASVSDLTIQEFNFLYGSPTGTGTAASFSYQEVKEQTALNVDVEKIDQDFQVTITGSESREFFFENAPSFLKDASHIDLRSFNAQIAERLSLSMSYGKFDSPDDSLELKDLNLSCDKAQGDGESVYIEGCIKKMNLKSKQFSSDTATENSNILTVAGQSLLEATNSKSLTIKSIDLKMTNGKFDLSAEIRAQISGSAKGSGNVSYDKETGKLTIKISEVKFGFLDVTSQVFDELKKQESAKLKVKKPYVYYQLK